PPTFEARSPILTTFWAAAGAARPASRVNDPSTARTVLFLMSLSFVVGLASRRGGIACSPPRLALPPGCDGRFDQPREGPRYPLDRLAHLLGVGYPHGTRRHPSRPRTRAATPGGLPALSLTFRLLERQPHLPRRLRVLLSDGK